MNRLISFSVLPLLLFLASCGDSSREPTAQDLNDIKQLQSAVDLYLMDRVDATQPRYKHLPKTIHELERSGYITESDLALITQNRSIEIIHPEAEPLNDFVYLRMIDKSKIFEVTWNGNRRILSR